MKLFHSMSILLTFGAASAKPSSPSNKENGPRSIAGLRELRKLVHENERGLFDDLLSGFGGLECGDTCNDPDKCTSFMSAPSPSVLKESCDAGCVPEVALSTCDQLCGDDDAAAVSVQRLGLFDAAADLVCGNCEFYGCCAGDGASYEACEGLLPDEDNFPDVDSLLPDFGFGDVLDLDSILPDFGDTSNDMPGLDLGAFLPDGFPDMGSLVPDWEDVSNGSGSASGLSILGQLGGIVGCPESCGDSELCDPWTVDMSGMDDETLKDACNVGCIPVVSNEFCEDTCGNIGEPKFMGSLVEAACDACRFVECCLRDGSDGEQFDACKELLPTTDGLLPDIDWDELQIQTAQWNLTDWGAGLGWSDVASGLSELVEAIHSLFGKALDNFQTADSFDYSFPVTCNPETCPIDGLCTLGTIPLSIIGFEDACKTNAFFECAEGLEEMCANECNAVASGNFLSTSFCSMCNMAECCRDNGGAKTFEDCAWEAVPEEISDAIGGIADVVENITESITEAFGQPSGLAPEELNESAGASVEASLLESRESSDTSTDNSDSDSLDDPIVNVAESEYSSSEDITAEVSSGGPPDAPADASASGLAERPGGPTEASASETPDVSVASRMEANVESGARASGASTIRAVASIAALAFVSI